MKVTMIDAPGAPAWFTQWLPAQLRKVAQAIANAVQQAGLVLTTKDVSASTDVEASDPPVIVVDSTAAPVTITLFPDAEAPNDGNIHRWWVTHVAGDNNVTVVVDGGAFADGLIGYVLPKSRTVQLGVKNGGGWLRIGTALSTEQVRRAAPLAAAAFAAPGAPIPFDIADRQDNTNIALWSPFLPLSADQVQILLAGRYQIGFSADIDSTGGATWNADVWLTVNDAEVPGTRRTTGNFGNEDQSVSLPRVTIDLNADDRVKLVASQTLLTGNLKTAVLAIDTFV